MANIIDKGGAHFQIYLHSQRRFGQPRSCADIGFCYGQVLSRVLPPSDPSKASVPALLRLSVLEFKSPLLLRVVHHIHPMATHGINNNTTFVAANKGNSKRNSRHVNLSAPWTIDGLLLQHFIGMISDEGA